MAQRIQRPFLYYPFLILNGAVILMLTVFIFLYLLIIADNGDGSSKAAKTIRVFSSCTRSQFIVQLLTDIGNVLKTARERELDRSRCADEIIFFTLSNPITAVFNLFATSIYVAIAVWFEYMVCRAYELTQLKRDNDGSCGLFSLCRACCC